MGSDLKDDASSRFGRAPYFLIVETEGDKLIESIKNPNASAGGGAGVQSGQLLADREVAAVLTGNCGPRAFEVFAAAEIDVYTGVSGSAQDTLNSFLKGELQKAGGANVESHHGI